MNDNAPDIRDLPLAAVVALNKATGREIEARKKSGEVLSPGVYSVDESLHIAASLSRAEDTSATPRFSPDALLRPVILLYADQAEDPVGWLDSILGNGGVLSTVAKLPTDKVERMIPTELRSAWDQHVANAKKIYQTAAGKIPRAGVTKVIATITPQPE